MYKSLVYLSCNILVLLDTLPSCFWHSMLVRSVCKPKNYYPFHYCNCQDYTVFCCPLIAFLLRLFILPKEIANIIDSCWRWWVLIIRVFLYDDSHSLQLVGLHVVVHEPVARVVSLEGNDNIASSWYDHCVLANGRVVEPTISEVSAKIRCCAISPRTEEIFAFDVFCVFEEQSIFIGPMLNMNYT